VLAALIIVFREVFEAGLIVGIVLAVTGSVPNRNRWIGGGVLAGMLAACLVAAFTGALSQLFAGMGQELFNAAILGVAVMMLTWHNVWMAHHGREMAGELRQVGQAVADGSKSLLALAVVVGVAVLREGQIVRVGTPRELTTSELEVEIRYRRDGEDVLLRTAEPTRVLHELTAEAIARGEELDRLEVRRPTLEDVYLALTEEDPA